MNLPVRMRASLRREFVISVAQHLHGLQSRTTTTRCDLLLRKLQMWACNIQSTYRQCFDRCVAVAVPNGRHVSQSIMFI